MSYLSKILQPGEELRHVSRLHWIVYLPGLALFVLGTAGYVAIAGGSLGGASNPLLLGGTGLVLLASLASLISAWLRRWTTEIAVTDKRIIFKRGLFRRYSIEMNMDKVESVDVEQSVFGRIFDYGDVIVRGTGSGIEPIRRVAAPLDFRNHVTAR